jgi:methionine synthase I (cobalamin-dependent)
MLLNNVNPFSLSKRINRPLILDGAMGSLLQKMGAEVDASMWMSLVNIKKPDIVLDAHRQYIKAGADIITTNTFRTNPLALNRYGKGINIQKLLRESVNLALEAAKGLPVFVAGSNPPAEDSYQAERKVSHLELKVNHSTHIDLLMENGCNFILNETQNHLDEIKIICEYCSKNNIPYLLSIYFNRDFKLYSGENAGEVLKYIIDYSPLAVGINCIKPDTFIKYLNKLNIDCNWGFYLNCGEQEFTDKNIKSAVTPGEYLNKIKKAFKKSPSFVGACCGSTPAHIKKLKDYFDGQYKN